MRIGLAGLGRIGVLHARTLAGLAEVEELVVCDAIAGRADEVAAELGVTAKDTPEAVLAAGVDGFVIAAATDAHRPLTLAAIEAGVPVLCEKPIAGSLAEAEEVAARAADAGATVAIGFQRRYDLAYNAARDAVVDGTLGRLHTVRAIGLDPAPPPMSYIAVSGGIFGDQSIHDLDILRYVLGQEAVAVYAIGSTNGDPGFAAAGDVDTAVAVLTFADGTVASLVNSRYNGAGHDVRLELGGTDASVAVGLDNKLPLRSLEAGVSFPAGTPWTFFMDRFADAYVAELTAFTEVVAGRAEPRSTVADALQTAYLADACTRSLREGRPVQLPGLS